MLVSEIVPLLANELMRSDLRLSDAQIRTLEVLAELPQYLERERLVGWDRDVRAEFDDVGLDPRATEMIDLISELCAGIVDGGFDATLAELIRNRLADVS